MKKSIFCFLAAACASAAVASIPAFNDGFEELDAAGWIKGWKHYGDNSWKIDEKECHSGKRSLFVDIDDPATHVYKRCAGAWRTFVFDEATTDPVHFGLWSKCEGVYNRFNYECCISLVYDDGSPEDWQHPGLSARFDPGTHGWQYSCSTTYPKKPVKRVNVYFFIRRGMGKAWFDDFVLERRDPGPFWMRWKRMTDRPFSDSGKLLVTIPDKTVSWESEAGGIRGSGCGSKLIEVPVPDSACDVRLSLSDGARTNVYTIAISASELAEPTLKRGEIRVWTADSMRRVTPLARPSGDNLASVSVDVDIAIGGTASAQILVSTGAGTPETEANVELGSLSDGNGRAFDGVFKWERTAYIVRQHDAMPQTSGILNEERWVPDPLLPAAPFRLRPGSTQGAWLTISASRDAKPGTYRGNAAVSAGGRRFTVPVAVTVHHFSLPKTFGMETSVASMESFIRRFYPGKEKKMLRVQHDIMLDHRLNADNMSRWDTPDIEDVRHAVSRGANRFCALALLYPPKNPGATDAPWPKPEEVDCPEFLAHIENTLAPFVKRLREEGLMKYAYLYGFDEREKEHYAGMDATWRKLKERFPDLPVLTTARMYKDMVKSGQGTNFPYSVTTDWYCPITYVWDRNLSEQLRTVFGKKTWFYTCCSPANPFANIASVENEWVDGRILAWQQYAESADGFLFWAADWWPETKRLDPGDTFQRGMTTHSPIGIQGDAVFTYPGPDAIYPSIRLAALRDGVQDYEWLKLAEAATSRAECEKACASFIRNLHDFDRDPVALLKARAGLARAIEKQHLR